MIPIPERAVELLHRHPRPALPVEVLEALLVREAGPGAGDPRLLEALARDGNGPQVVEAPRRRRWASHVHPQAWILNTRPPREGRCSRTLPALMARSLRSLARGLDPDSTLAWARWNRLLEEEVPARKVLLRKMRSPRGEPGERPRTTTSLPDLRRGG